MGLASFNRMRRKKKEREQDGSKAQALNQGGYEVETKQKEVRDSGKPEQVVYEEMNVKQLKETAAAKGHKGVHTLRREELLDLLGGG